MRTKQSIALSAALFFAFSNPAISAPEAPPAATSGTDMNLSSTSASVTATRGAAIRVGNSVQTVAPGQMLTPAQAAAVAQVLQSGAQNLVLGALGNAVAGSLSIGPTVNHFTNFVVPKNVTVTNSLPANGVLNIDGALHDAGKLFAVASSPATTTATFIADTITVAPNALLSTALNLSLVTTNGITNAGLIESTKGSINLAAAPNGNGTLNVSAAGGTFSAPQGTILVGSPGANTNINLTGGNWLSKSLTLDAGAGEINALVGQVSGTLSSSASYVHFIADSTNLSLGANCINGGDPLYANTGNITIDGFVTNGSDANLSIVAGGNIIGTANSAIVGQGGNAKIYLIAGANIVGGTNIGGQTIPGSASGLPVSVSFDNNFGGNIDLSANTQSTAIDNHGGNVYLIAHSNADDNGNVWLSSNSAIDTSSTSGPAGSLEVIAGGHGSVARPYAIDLGPIKTMGFSSGSVSLTAAQPLLQNGIATFQPNGDTDAIFVAGSTQANASIRAGQVDTWGRAGADAPFAGGVPGGTGGNGGAVTATGTGSIKFSSINSSGGSGGAGTFGGFNVANPGTVGGAGGNAGSIQVSAQQIDLGTVTAVGGNGGAGGKGGNTSDPVGPTGGNGGNGGNAGSITTNPLATTITFQSINAVGGSAGKGGDAGFGQTDGAGGNAGTVGSSGVVTLQASGTQSSISGGAISVQGASGALGGFGQISGGVSSASGDGGSITLNAGTIGVGNIALSGSDGLISFSPNPPYSSPNPSAGGKAGTLTATAGAGSLTTGNITAKGGKGGSWEGAAVHNVGRDGADGGDAGSVDLTATNGTITTLNINLTGGSGGNGDTGESIAGKGGDGAKGGTLIASGRAFHSGNISATAGNGGSGPMSGSASISANDGGNGADARPIQITAANEISIGLLEANGGSGGSGSQNGTSAGGNGGNAGNASVIEIKGGLNVTVALVTAQGGWGGQGGSTQGSSPGNGGVGGAGGTLLVQSMRDGLTLGNVQADGGPAGFPGFSGSIPGISGAGGTAGSVELDAAKSITATNMTAVAGDSVFGSTAGKDGGTINVTSRLGGFTADYVGAFGGAGGYGTASSLPTAGGSGGSIDISVLRDVNIVYDVVATGIVGSGFIYGLDGSGTAGGAGGTISIKGANIQARSIDASGADGGQPVGNNTVGGTGGAGGTIDILASGSLTSEVAARGGYGGASNGGDTATGGNGGDGGSISAHVGNTVSFTHFFANSLDVSGGPGGTAGSLGGVGGQGGNGGTAVISAGNGIIFGTATAQGGRSGYSLYATQAQGNGGSLHLFAGAGGVIGNLVTAGSGTPSAADANAPGGNGGSVAISGNTIVLASGVDVRGGSTSETGGNGGVVFLNSINSMQVQNIFAQGGFVGSGFAGDGGTGGIIIAKSTTGNMTIAQADVSGGSGSRPNVPGLPGGKGGAAGSIELQSGGALTITQAFASGGAGGNGAVGDAVSEAGSGGSGGKAGYIALTASGALTARYITSDGGAGGGGGTGNGPSGNGGAGGVGGDAGTATLVAGSIVIPDANSQFSTRGGQGGAGGSAGSGLPGPSGAAGVNALLSMTATSGDIGSESLPVNVSAPLLTVTAQGDAYVAAMSVPVTLTGVNSAKTFSLSNITSDINLASIPTANKLILNAFGTIAFPGHQVSVTPSGTTGGTIDLEASSFTWADSATQPLALIADGQNGGTVLVKQNSGTLTVNSAPAAITVSAKGTNGNGGTADLIGAGLGGLKLNVAAIDISASGNGNGGNLFLTGTDIVNIGDTPAILSANGSGTGNGGNVAFNTSSANPLTIGSTGAWQFSATGANGGTISVQAQQAQIQVDPAALNVSANTVNGSVGSISLSAKTVVPITGSKLTFNLSANPAGTGNGGGIAIFQTAAPGSVSIGAAPTANFQFIANSGKKGGNGGRVTFVNSSGTDTLVDPAGINANPLGPIGNGATIQLQSLGGNLAVNGNLAANAKGKAIGGYISLIGGNGTTPFVYGTKNFQGNGVKGTVSVTGTPAGSIILSGGASDINVNSALSPAASTIQLITTGNINVGASVGATTTGSVLLSGDAGIKTTTAAATTSGKQVTLASLGSISGFNNAPFALNTPKLLSVNAVGLANISNKAAAGQLGDVNVTGQSVFAFSGTGSLTQLTGTKVVADDVRLASFKNVGAVNQPLETSTGNLTVTKLGGIARIHNDQALDLLSSSFANLQLSAEGSIDASGLITGTSIALNSTNGGINGTLKVGTVEAVAKGNINLMDSATAVTLGNVQSVNGTVSVQNTNATGTITVRKNSTISAGGNSVGIYIGTPPSTPVAGPTPANVSKTGNVFFGTKGITALAPTNTLTTGATGQIVFSTGTAKATAIKLGGGVNINVPVGYSTGSDDEFVVDADLDD